MNSSLYERIEVRAEGNLVSVGLEPSEHFTGIRYNLVNGQEGNYAISVFFCAKDVRVGRDRGNESTLTEAKSACLKMARDYAGQLAKREKLEIKDFTQEA